MNDIQPTTLTEDESRLLRTYVDRPRIWDAAAVVPIVFRLESLGMIAPRGSAYAITAAGVAALAHD